MATARSSKTKTKANRTSTKRERLSPGGDTRYVRRDSAGQFKESDDAGRSQQSDRRTKAKKLVRSGNGDRGDRRVGRGR